MKLALIYRDFAHWTTGTCYQRALAALGVSFTSINNNVILQNRIDLRTYNYDAAICIDNGFGVQHLPNLPRKSVFIAIDPHNGWTQHYEQHISQFAKIYAAQYELGVVLLAKHGFKADWLPLAFDDIAMNTPRQDRTEWLYDVCYVASWSTTRRIQIRDILRNSDKYRSFTPIAFREELADAYYRSKVGINDYGLQTDLVMRKDHVNQRVFEVMGCGAMLLNASPEVQDLNMIFPMSRFQMVSWEETEDCLEKLDWYLAHDAEREKIARAGQEIVRSDHTYKHRIKKVLEDLEKM